MRTNAWVLVEKARALTWRDWYRWTRTGGEEPEPPLSNWEKKAVTRLADAEYIFKGFLRPTILTKEWILLSVYDVTENELDSGYNQLGDAATGGDFGVAGLWLWLQGQSFSQFVDYRPWQPAQVLKFMPPTYAPDGTPIPATGVRDVNLLFGQPPREFPA